MRRSEQEPVSLFRSVDFSAEKDVAMLSKSHVVRAVPLDGAAFDAAQFWRRPGDSLA